MPSYWHLVPGIVCRKQMPLYYRIMHKERKDGKSAVFCFIAVGGVKDFSHIYGKSATLLGQRKEFLLGWLITIAQPFHITRIIQRTNTPQKKKCLVGFLFQVITNNDKICDIICTIRNPFSHFGTLRLALYGNNGYKNHVASYLHLAP